jgi:hypothetical protein
MVHKAVFILKTITYDGHSHSIISWRRNSLIQFELHKNTAHRSVRNTVSKFRLVAIVRDRLRY